MLLSILLPTPTISTASTSVTLATPANRVGVAGQDREGTRQAPATVPSPAVHPDRLLNPAGQMFDGPQEDPTMLAATTTAGLPAAGLKRSAVTSPSGFTSYCWLNQPAAAQ